MVRQEPGFWIEWIAGIVGAIVAGLVVAALRRVRARLNRADSDAKPDGDADTGRPRAHHRVLDAGDQHRRGPRGPFKVYDAGDDNADRYAISWNAPGPSPDAPTGVIYSDEFSVEPQASHEPTLRGVMPFQFARSFISGAMVRCLNATSKVAIELVSVRAAAPGA